MSKIWTHQNGLILIPDPRGEKGLTFDHMRASFTEIADFPSSKKYARPWNIKQIRLKM